MKHFCIIVFALILLSSVYSYSQDTKDTIIINKFSERILFDLEIEVNVKQTMPIGYAYCFKANVLKVTRGVLSDENILITVLAGDTLNLNILRKTDENTTLKLFLMHNSSYEKYPTTYITGFVDSDKNSWKIVEIQEQ